MQCGVCSWAAHVTYTTYLKDPLSTHKLKTIVDMMALLSYVQYVAKIPCVAINNCLVLFNGTEF